MNKRNQLAVMRVEDFKSHLRTIVGEDPKAAITGGPRPNRLLVRKNAARAQKKRRR